MVQRIKDFVLGSVLVLALFIIPSGIGGNIETHYKLNAVVTEINNDIVTVEDKNGNEWEFIGTDFEIGQNVKMTMFNHYTDNTIEDDEIIKVKVV